ncbi:multidrug MFS transporter [Rhodobacter sp. TJ_12]|uniref:multidrug effflux MFS transporter n=1 Tax=Rhodobacter sp. TJ_12 TaxID=2029399 RepID=UPI001CC05AD6|nr:multidrug effflux MFS transporter [Rhodobacter sp. TJ_12]MBZ4022497.1 multidrug MFS transporter [Rhodobacter sp. TJ_12]
MTDPQTPDTAPVRRLPMYEFTAMMALLAATVAFSIDAMLPALPEIAQSLSPEAVNRAQLVLTSFVGGMGVGTFLTGPLSDAIGRKLTLLLGAVVFVIGAFIGAQADSLEVLLAARFLQGFGAAAPRIVPMALVRDLYAGREMAKVTAFIMMVFILVPALAPSAGQVIIGFAGWRGVFYAFILFALIGLTWLSLRQPETLAREKRRPLHPTYLIAGAKEVLGHREVRLYILVLTLGFGQMFAMLSSAQQVFAAFDVVESFPRWFALMAVIAGTGNAFNAFFVMRLGMRRIVRGAYLLQIISSATMLILVLTGAVAPPTGFVFLFFWSITVFMMAGITFGNLNALAMQHMGHLAGMTASVVSAISTVGAVVIAVPVGLLFNGTPLPLVIATLTCSALAFLIMGYTDDPS